MKPHLMESRTWYTVATNYAILAGLGGPVSVLTTPYHMLHDRTLNEIGANCRDSYSTSVVWDSAVALASYIIKFL